MATEKITFCRICEPYCGLRVTVDKGRAVATRPDRDHPLSQGFACKVGLAAHELAHDPDRVTRPLKKVQGTFRPVSWDDALDDIAQRVGQLCGQYGPHSLAVYFGNPAAFHYPHRLYGVAFCEGVGTRNIFGAGSTDNLAIFAAAKLMFGSPVLLPIPDIDHSDFVLMLGVNPAVSHGTLINLHRPTPRLRAIAKRGAQLVVVDPYRTATAALATAHHAIRPDTDAWLLLAMLQTICSEGLADDTFVRKHTRGFAALRQAVKGFTAQRAAAQTGLSEATITDLARRFANADAAVAYGRLTCGRFGTLCSWAINALNVITGNLDRRGGCIFGEHALDVAALAHAGDAATYGKYRSRIGGHPDVFREFPIGILADEITTPGEGQVRAMIVDAGNPVVSAPDGHALVQALGQLDLLVAIDLYRNETTRHADYILPATTFLERQDFTLLHASLMSEPYLQWTEAIIDPVGEAREEWTIFRDLGQRLGHAPWNRRWLAPIWWALERIGRPATPAFLMDLALRFGPLGDKGLPWLKPDGLSLAKVKAAPHGLRIPCQRTGVIAQRLRTPDKRVNLWPVEIAAELQRLRAITGNNGADQPLQLIGRRDVRSHNSWVHNLPSLMKNRPPPTLQVHPDDAAALGLVDGQLATVAHKDARLQARCEVTDNVMAGVVSLPHGWSQESEETRQVVAANPGPNANAICPRDVIEPLSGMAFLNGFPVRVTPVAGST